MTLVADAAKRSVALRKIPHSPRNIPQLLTMLFAAPVFGGSRLAASIRVLMVASGMLALAG